MSNKTNPSQTEEIVKPLLGVEGGRQRLLSVLERLHGAEGGVLTSKAPRELDSLLRKFRESQFYLVFLGQFKRGKTTLLNAFVGTDLLPTGVLPLTSIITIVRYGPQPRASAKFADGSLRHIKVSDLPSYITEVGNPKNKKGVLEVEVLYPAAQLQDGLCLVDTPGTGSVFEHNTQLSYEFVPRADAALFVFSPESPLSQTELNFLRHLRAYVEKIFFVMNKVDQVSEQERAEIVAFARNAIREQMPTSDLRLFSVSARQALAAKQRSESGALEVSGLPSLVASLDQFLASHGKELLVRATCASVRRVVGNVLLGLELEQHALALSVAEIEQKIQVIRQAWQALDQRHREAGYILRGEISSLERNLEEQLNEFVEAEVPRLVSYMQQKLRENQQASKRQMVRALEEHLVDSIAEIFEEWKIKEEKSIGQAFEVLTSRFSQEASQTVERIQQVATEQFGFTWTTTPLPDRLTTESRFRLRVEGLMTWGLGQFPFLLPKRLFLRYLEGRLHDACVEELSRHAGRLKAVLGGRLEESMNRYLRALDQHVEEARESVLAALNRAAHAKQAEESTAERKTSAQSLRPAFLRQIDQELSALQKEWEGGCEARATH